MGYRICYIAAKSEPQALAEALGLEVSEAVSETPDGWWAARLTDGGWSILWCDDEAFGENVRDKIGEFSRQTDVIHCEVNETCMWSSVEAWSGGKSAWRVTHAGDGQDIFDLTVQGEPPDDLAGIRDKFFAAQGTENDCDHVFEIPLELARERIKFRHEDYLRDSDVLGFHPVIPPRRTGLLARLFGRS